MLYNPKWDKGSLLDQWIAWLETKDPDECYQWINVSLCACGQFYGDSQWIAKREFDPLNKIARGEPRECAIGMPEDAGNWNFGKCLERAKRYRETQHLGHFAVQ